MNLFFRSVNHSLLILTLFLVTIFIATNDKLLLLVLTYLLITNSIFCFLFLLDKKRAKMDGQRISELSLSVTALLSFNLSTLLMQELIRHKTIKWQFNGKLFITFVIQNILLLFYFFLQTFSKI
ncbi:hypothetical protein C1E24_13825 [Pseudoalteromonas phenolica]|uniref:DUF1294 domain-containing protein n=1 Tax=Pseudoalteromonas phenolica TaxID=161398 RepID=A0A5R9Q007_9GAMM|nr:hypothetical protein C1E24_13825 [Pseudoalteromonas phenolica]